jgi:hypothetical protein
VGGTEEAKVKLCGLSVGKLKGFELAFEEKEGRAEEEAIGETEVVLELKLKIGEGVGSAAEKRGKKGEEEGVDCCWGASLWEFSFTIIGEKEVVRGGKLL